MGVVETADGFINIGVGGDAQWQNLCRAMERPDLGAEPDYATADDRSEHRKRLGEVLAPVFKQRTSDDWLQRLEECDVPAGPIYKMDEVFADPQVQHLGMAQAVDHPARGPIEVVGQPVVLERTPASIDTAAPDAGDHTDEILGELGMSASEIAQLKAENVV